MQSDDQKIEEIRGFFNEGDWNSLTNFDKLQKSNIFNNYKILLNLGVTINPPDFVRVHKENEHRKKVATEIIPPVVKISPSKRIVSPNLRNKAHTKLPGDGIYLLNSTLTRMQMYRNCKKKPNKQQLRNYIKESKTLSSQSLFENIVEDLVQQAKTHIQNIKNGQKLDARKLNFDLVQDFAWVHKYKNGESDEIPSELPSHLNIPITNINQIPIPCEDPENDLGNIRSFRKPRAVDYIEKIREKYLGSHMRMNKNHMRKYQNLCVECGKSFSSDWHLKNHISTVHRKIKRFECVKCDQKFTQGFSLRRHMSCIHEGKRFHCAICDKQFSRTFNLKNHQLIHIGEKQTHLCEMCGEAFNSRANLEIHQLSHDIC